MTDRDRLASLLRDFGIHFEEHEAEEWWPGRHNVDGTPYPRPDNPEVIPAHLLITSEGTKNTGYDGFYCMFAFADDGSFLTVEVAE